MQTFTFRDAKTGETVTWASGLAVLMCAETKMPTVKIRIDRAVVDQVERNNGIEQYLLDSISANQIKRFPILLMHVGANNETILLDGNHRFVKAHQLGFKEIDAYVLTEQQMKPFVIDLSDKVQNELLTTPRKTFL